MNEKELLNLKEKINQAKTKVSELKGRQDYLMQDLQDNWKCKTIKEAKIRLEDLEQEIKETNNKIEKAIVELKEKYNV
jgi:outer membrane murein-binding lipoprotein Lpp